MPSTIHQGLAWAFADDPPLGFELMREVFGLPVPDLESITDRRAELDRYAPCFGDSRELRPDLALSGDLARRAKLSKFVGGVALIVEVQRKIEWIKRWRLWVYWALLAERLRRTTVVMLVTLEDDVAAWARELGSLELCPNESLLVLNRQNMPRILDFDLAQRRPSKALLSALLHSINDDIDVMQTAFTAAMGLADDRRWRYASAILAAASEERSEQLKGSVTMEERYELTRVERNSIAWHDGHEEGRQEGRQEGQREVRQAMIETLLSVLALRSLEPDAATERRIRSCTDTSLLQCWTMRAVRATSVTELF